MTEISELVDHLRGDGAVVESTTDWLSMIDFLESRISQVRCTRHPLGFLHLDLSQVVRLRSAESLRLHYWPHVGSRPDDLGTLHDHVWNLASVVAAGRLRDRTYQVMPDSDGTYRGTSVKYGEANNEFKSGGRFELELDRDLIVGPNQIYRISSRTVHDSEVLEAPAVTFVLANDDEQASSRGPLILQSGSGGAGTAVRELFDCSAALSLVRRRLTGTATG